MHLNAHVATVGILQPAQVARYDELRGGLSMVLVLSLVADFPHRPFLVTVTFGVVLLSILVQGLTIGPLLKRIGEDAAKQKHL